jgi:hypothetical protein
VAIIYNQGGSVLQTPPGFPDNAYYKGELVSVLNNLVEFTGKATGESVKVPKWTEDGLPANFGYCECDDIHQSYQNAITITAIIVSLNMKLIWEAAVANNYVNQLLAAVGTTPDELAQGEIPPRWWGEEIRARRLLVAFVWWIFTKGGIDGNTKEEALENFIASVGRAHETRTPQTETHTPQTKMREDLFRLVKSGEIR